MLNSQKDNIRNVLRVDCGSQVRLQEINIKKAILYLANNYTSAKFDNPLTPQQVETIEECATIVLEDFPMLAIEEIRLAFRMAASRKLKGVSLKAYFGKFNGDMLGEVLSAYLSHRNNVITTYDSQKAYEDKMAAHEKQEELNELARTRILEYYVDSLMKFNESIEDFNIERDLRASDAKPLVEMGVIVFDLDEKKEILKESKIDVIRKLKAEIHNKKNSFSKLQSIKHTLKKVADQQKDIDFDAKVLARYSKLLILKSIIND